MSFQQTKVNLKLPFSFILSSMIALVVSQWILFQNADLIAEGYYRTPALWMAFHLLILGFARYGRYGGYVSAGSSGLSYPFCHDFCIFWLNDSFSNIRSKYPFTRPFKNLGAAHLPVSGFLDTIQHTGIPQENCSGPMVDIKIC
ncbi:hypothetical protein GCM10008986_17890 [Salinibacillus aidingensis]|uniref:Uncharacterized protein n=1 Tax=Salinibacillus aidingensis TaxID=237684 RepID=A0ABP3L522_9BACI